MKALVAFCFAVILLAQSAVAATVSLQRVPEGGLQPQVVTDNKGVVHLVYLKGEPRACDVFYARLESGAAKFSAPLRVNSEPNSAIAIGTIRGAQLALGRNGRVHVAWNGGGKLKPGEKHPQGTLNYARLDDAGKAFEPQRNLIGSTVHLDGGASVAADALGNTFVVWHATTAQSTPGEKGRRVYAAKSTDDGKTFAVETPVNMDTTGVCGCCSLKAATDHTGALQILFRSATGGLDRDMWRISAKGKDSGSEKVQPWRLGTCPMSSASIHRDAKATYYAWETAQQIHWDKTDADGRAVSPTNVLPGRGQRKHPALATNAKGELLIAWAENTGWQRGGDVAWQLYDSASKPAKNGTAQGVPVWSYPAAFADAVGNFIILH